MTFSEKNPYSDIIGQNWHSYNTELKNSNCVVKNRYSKPVAIQLAKIIEKLLLWEVFSGSKWNY